MSQVPNLTLERTQHLMVTLTLNSQVVGSMMKVNKFAGKLKGLSSKGNKAPGLSSLPALSGIASSKASLPGLLQKPVLGRIEQPNEEESVLSDSAEPKPTQQSPPLVPVSRSVEPDAMTALAERLDQKLADIEKREAALLQKQQESSFCTIA